MKLYCYQGQKVYLRKEEYRNNDSLAVFMYKDNGEPYGPITVNLDSPLQSCEHAFLDEKNFPGIRRWLTKNKLGEFTGYEACPGSYSYPLFMLF